MKKMNRFNIILSTDENLLQLEEIQNIPIHLQVAFMKNFFFSESTGKDKEAFYFLNMLCELLSAKGKFFSSIENNTLILSHPIGNSFLNFIGSHDPEKERHENEQTQKGERPE